MNNNSYFKEKYKNKSALLYEHSTQEAKTVYFTQNTNRKLPRLKFHHSITRHRWQHTKTDVKEIWFDCINLIHLAQDMVQWWAPS
jgi:hypothetical protein